MSNIPRNFDAAGKAATPTAIEIVSIEIEAHNGTTSNIKEMVPDFQITESLISPTLLLKLTVVDEYNVLAELPLIGQEKIKISLKRKTNDATPIDEKFEHTFFITEYPEYVRDIAQENSAIYTLRGVSEHSYKSPFLKISRSTSGLTSDEIKKIFLTDLGVVKYTENGTASSRFKGIINTQSPLQAASWLLNKTYDNNFAPFYLYQTMDGFVNFASLSNLAVDKPYFGYKAKTTFEPGISGEIGYRDEASKIRKIESDLRLAKGFLAMSGVFASKQHYLDISKKALTNHKYGYSQMSLSNTLEGKPTLSSAFTIDGQPYDTLYDTHHQWISTNEMAFKSKKNFNDLKKKSKGITKAYMENLETYTHTLEVAGDLNLNPGKVVELELPKASPPDNDVDNLDKQLSGKYLVWSCVHMFSSATYTLSFKVKRDSFSIDV